MKIMFVTLSLGSGGAERVVSVLANTFVQLNHDVTIVLTANNRVYYRLSDKIRIICLKDKWDINQAAFLRVFNRIQSIREVVDQESPDIVISFLSVVNMEASVALINRKIPLIVSERNDPSIDPPGRIKKYLRRFVYYRPNGFVFQTEDAKRYFCKHIQKKSTVILNPLVAQLPEYYAGEREKRIVSVGRLDQQKNYPLLLDAFSLFHKDKPEYVLEIYGEGVQEEKIRNIIKEKKLADCVKLMGFCKDVHEKINKASLFVMTSDYEGLPNALIEAMALGLPCISTDCPCGGPRSLIDNEKNGILVKVGDADALQKAMISILEDPQYKDMGNTARTIKSRVDPQFVSEQWLDYINRIIKG